MKISNIRRIIILSVILFCLLIMFIIFQLMTSSKPGSLILSPTPTLIPKITSYPTIKLDITRPKEFLSPSSGKIINSGIEMNDFMISPVKTNKNGDILIEDTQNYQIVYLKQSDQFIISVLAKPFDSVFEEAQNEFIRVLGISQQDSCMLNVVVNTISSVDPDLAGKNYSLSWCVAD